jgi:hypothetical protein
MRDEAIVLLAVVSSIAFFATGVACAKPDLNQYPENSRPPSGMFTTALYRPVRRATYLEPFALAKESAVTSQCCSSSSLHPERTRYAARRGNPVPSSYPVADLRLGTPMVSPRMITWSICSTTTDGSALSIYSRSEKSGRSLQGSAIREDVGSHECADHDGDDEDGGADENPIAGGT